MIAHILLRRVLIQPRQVVNINIVPKQILRHIHKRLHILPLRPVHQRLYLPTLNQLSDHFMTSKQLAGEMVVVAHCELGVLVMETHERYGKLTTKLSQSEQLREQINHFLRTRLQPHDMKHDLQNRLLLS